MYYRKTLRFQLTVSFPNAVSHFVLKCNMKQAILRARKIVRDDAVKERYCSIFTICLHLNAHDVFANSEQ